MDSLMTGDNLMSAYAFKWAVTLATGIVAGAWFFYDLYNLSKLKRADRRDPLVHDKRFGYYMGMIIGIAGVIGCLRFHDVL